MSDRSNFQDDEVKITMPDRTLLRKLGGINLDMLFSDKVIIEAQKVIERAADDFTAECLADLKKLETHITRLKNSPDKAGEVLKSISEIAFAIKSRAGLGGYNLVSTIAKSLQTIAEKHQFTKVETNNISLMAWHVDSIKQLFSLKMKGTGGDAGKAIEIELKKLG